MTLPFAIFMPTIKHRDAVSHPALICGTVATSVNNVARDYPKANDCEQRGEFRPASAALRPNATYGSALSTPTQTIRHNQARPGPLGRVSILPFHSNSGASRNPPIPLHQSNILVHPLYAGPNSLSRITPRLLTTRTSPHIFSHTRRLK